MWTKICGIRDLDTAQRVALLLPDAIGLNFFAGSRRLVGPDVAAAIVRELPDRVEPVGVFVNHALDDVRAICRQTGLRTVQLHGDEPPELAAALTDLDVIRVYRVGAAGLAPVAADLERCRSLGVRLRACLVEAHIDGSYGGTGRTAPWTLLRDGWQLTDWPPLILAGGLTPDNVAQAVRSVRPWGVDVASGVESAPGVKDVDRVAGFLRAARG